MNTPAHIIAHHRAHSLPFNLGVFDDNTAVVGMQGSGKTYDSKVIVERFVAAGERVLIVDPTDVWWGFRSSSSGKEKGFDIPIFGGDHGDVKITERSAELIARHFAKGNRCAIVSTAHFKHRAEGRRFVARLFETLYDENRDHCRLVVDEADEFAPQNPLTDAEIESLSAFDRIVRRGRVRGFRVLMITQRTSVINKNLLSQAGAAIAHRLTGTTDRKAVEEWVRANADVDAAKEFLSSIPALDDGEAWVWAPRAKILKRVKFPTIATFDSSATPKRGQLRGRRPKVWTEADMGEIKAAIEPPKPAVAPIDPKNPYHIAAKKKEAEEFERRVNEAAVKKIQEFRAGMEKLAAALREPARAFISSVKHAIAMAEEQHTAAVKLRHDMLKHEKLVEGDAKTLDRAVDSFLQLVRKSNEKQGVAAPKPGSMADVMNALSGSSAPAPAPSGGKPPPPPPSGDGSQRIVDALAWWSRIGIQNPTRTQVYVIARYSLTSSQPGKLVKAACDAGLVVADDRGLRLTQDGAAKASLGGDASADEIPARVRAVLDANQVKFFDALQAGPLSRSELYKATGYSPTSSQPGKILASVLRMGLLVDGGGQISVAGWISGGAS